MDKCGIGDIFGVTKLDENHQILSSNVVVGSSHNFEADSKDFIRDFYFSDEWIKNANENNAGFIGSIARGQDGFSILCNGIGDSDLVAALGWAEDNEGVGHVQGTKRENKTWGQLKMDLKERQIACVSRILQEENTKAPSAERESR